MTCDSLSRTRPQAIEMLASCQASSKYFSDFDFQQLITLAKELTILRFKERETVLFQGEPATFFGVILKGALASVVSAERTGQVRGVGEVIGEMALFAGGTRSASMEATQDGYLAVFSFAQLDHLYKSHRDLADKLSRQLALAALEKQAPNFGALSKADVEDGVGELLSRRTQRAAETPVRTAPRPRAAAPFTLQRPATSRAVPRLLGNGPRRGVGRRYGRHARVLRVPCYVMLCYVPWRAMVCAVA
jgi:CRP-like cAMP-binding protein